MDSTDPGDLDALAALSALETAHSVRTRLLTDRRQHGHATRSPDHRDHDPAEGR